MRHTLAGFLVLFGCLSLCSAQAPKAAVKTAKETLQELQLDLREVKGLAAAVTDKNLRARLEKAIAQMEHRCEELAKQLQAVTVTPAKQAVSDADFAKFLKALQGQSFDDGKLAILKDYSRQSYFTSAQAATVVKSHTFSKGQTEAAITLHPRLVDPANFFEVLGVFTFDSDKQAVRKALNLK